jgi:alpha-N-arabinofuranosidase
VQSNDRAHAVAQPDPIGNHDMTSDSLDSHFDNPILPGFYPDPSICRVGDDYYLVTSSFEYFPGVPIFHSRDLVSWRQIGNVLTRDSQLPLAKAKSSEGIFAPTLRYREGTFYLVTTNVGGGGSFFVTSSDPAGPWSEPVWLPEPTFTMDPSLLFASDGSVYYTRHGGGERGGAYQARIDVRTGRFASDPVQIWSGTGGVWPEGPHLYEIDGTYYLMISEGGTSVGHMITVARSTSPMGPFEAYPQNPILTHRNTSQPIQATGHGDLVQTAEGQWWLVLLGIRRWDGSHHHLGRETFLAPVRFDEAGWPVVNDGRPIELRMSTEGLPPRSPWPVEPTRDDFDGSALDPSWVFVRNPDPASWSLAERPGFLRLRGSPTTLRDVGSPSFAARRQRHFRASASTRLELSPNAEGQHAGLAVRANEANHHHVTLTTSAGQRRIQLTTRIDGSSRLVADEPAPSGPIVLRVEAYADRYEFFFEPATGGSRALGSAPTAALSTESAGGFTGVTLGPVAWSEAVGSMPPADFDWFDYQPK